uniref:NADH dehydrogenase [ubiquinone] 1 alpha subcomplex subunit 5 n=1 Tax=Panagrellus redivivus TaxID=6233 RepID=A0A7E4V8S9_PANRE
MSALPRALQRTCFVAARQQQITPARFMYQNPYIFRFKKKNEVSPDFHKKTTGLTGLFVNEHPHHTLKVIYGRILRSLQQIPATSAYRKYTEDIVSNRLSLVENESDIQKLENKIGMGQIEEVIEQAELELETVRAIIDSKAWEPLVEAPAANQWRWPVA